MGGSSLHCIENYKGDKKYKNKNKKRKKENYKGEKQDDYTSRRTKHFAGKATQ